MSGHRQAALALHGLDEEDQKLILGRLPPSDQAALRNHLTELRALGFESELAQLAVPFQAEPGRQVSAHERVQAASAGAIFALIEHEPASLVAQVLALSDWQWKAALLDLYSPSRRTVICAIRPDAAPARQRFLMNALAARLAPGQLKPVQARKAGVVASIRDRVRAWIR